ncbi:MAG: polymer-forming cytoskeletal protein [Silvanigrellaceae bacterium]|nr:polymer-forming cytoskeletal protein [Silvanigrellaceae bacterium]
MFSKESRGFLSANSQSIDIFEKKNKKSYFSLLGQDTFFEGKLVLKGETRIAGRLEGTIISEGTLIFEETSNVKGEIQGNIVEISGRFQGIIHVAKILRLTSSAILEGEITSEKLVVEEGAKLRGKVTYPDENNIVTLHAPTTPHNSQASHATLTAI